MLALEFGTPVASLLEAMTARELLQWMAFLAVREERRADAQRNAAEGYDDDDVYEWGEDEA